MEAVPEAATHHLTKILRTEDFLANGRTRVRYELELVENNAALEVAFRVGLGTHRPGDTKAMLDVDDDDTDAPVVVEGPDGQPEGHHD